MMDEKISKVCVVGLGYIGLPTAAIFAQNNIQVVGVDTNMDVVSTINEGEIHIVEPGLGELVSNSVETGRLRATHVPEDADAFIIAVPTPVVGDAKEPDLSYVRAAAVAIARVLKPGDLVILESTCPVGATETLIQWLAI
jgi:UDP-N-acetyl-D-mannosaminuronic acid dehydrogenase